MPPSVSTGNADTDEGASEYNATEAFRGLQEDGQIEALFQCFQDFLQNSACKTLMNRSETINSYSTTFIEYVSIYYPQQEIELSTRKGSRSVVTRTKSFRTNVGESQPTQEAGTPNALRSEKIASQTPAANGRGHGRKRIIPETSEEDADENEN